MTAEIVDADTSGMFDREIVELIAAAAADGDMLTASELEKVLLKVGYVDCVWPAFYPALKHILAIIEKQRECEFERRTSLVMMAVKMKFAFEQEAKDCPTESKE